MASKGGARPGAGKPAIYGKKMRRINVILDDETIAFYMGKGANLSQGIRNYWRGLVPADIPPNRRVSFEAVSLPAEVVTLNPVDPVAPNDG